MVCSILCAPAITVLVWISEKLGFPEGVTGLFLGALVVWFAELQSNLIYKKREKKGKKTGIWVKPLIIIINLVLVAYAIGMWGILKR